jgi:hypothetical protein
MFSQGSSAGFAYIVCRFSDWVMCTRQGKGVRCQLTSPGQLRRISIVFARFCEAMDASMPELELCGLGLETAGSQAPSNHPSHSPRSLLARTDSTQMTSKPRLDALSCLCPSFPSSFLIVYLRCLDMFSLLLLRPACFSISIYFNSRRKFTSSPSVEIIMIDFIRVQMANPDPRYQP